MEYSALYRYYDDLMKDYPYGDILSFCLDALKDTGAKTGFEFACGTGRLTAALAERGYEMTATDLSLDMLNLAVRRTQGIKPAVRLLSADVNRPEFLKKYDFVVSFTDGFNYVSSVERFDALLKKTAAALNTGGLLIFDMSTVFKAEHVLSEQLFFEDGEELTVFWQNTKYGGNKIGMELTFFEKRGETYIRSDEKNTQYFYTAETVEGLLKKNGFGCRILDGTTFKGFTDRSERIIVLARKLKVES
ncbi:MAG: class I SAM-dependent methyltransferase [Clostridiales bacterium]|jgi:SAM-dependent methyltransferase|nr:class I SAM-dependent methyltransferase [Clostridiales bacterium]